MTPPVSSAIPEALPNSGSPETGFVIPDQEQLATVRQLHPFGIPLPPDYVYAPLECADLQVRDNLRRELAASALALRPNKSERLPVCDENLVYRQIKRGHSIDMSEHYAKLAKDAEQMFWTTYAGAVLARQATAEE